MREKLQQAHKAALKNGRTTLCMPYMEWDARGECQVQDRCAHEVWLQECKPEQNLFVFNTNGRDLGDAHDLTYEDEKLVITWVQYEQPQVVKPWDTKGKRVCVRSARHLAHQSGVGSHLTVSTASGAARFS